MNLIRPISRFPTRRWDPNAHKVQASTGIRLKKSSGQYLITNEDLLDKIVVATGAKASDTILELGSGSGAITSRLASVARKVYVCETDDMLANETLKRVESEGFTNVSHLKGDAMSVNFPRFDVCVSNMPYSLSAPLLFKLIKHRPLWRSAVLLLQREFTDALIAEPGERNYSRLSMNASVFVRTERVHRVNGACFYPIPPVESAVVRLTPRNPPPAFDFSEFSALTKIAFIEKKKTLKTVFSRPFVEKLLETNYKNYCSFHRIPTSRIPFRTLLQSVIADSGLAECPAKYLPPDAMEFLLSRFHESGIYFTSIASSPTLSGEVSDTLTRPFLTSLPPQPVPRQTEEEDDYSIPTVS